jgi:hypothetical protein
VLERAVRVPYGFHNGSLNLIRPATFRDLDTAGILRKAGRFAVEGELFRRHPDPELGEMRLIVVGEFGSEQKKAVSAVREALQAHGTELYTTQDVPRLVDVIRSTAQVHAGDT